VKLSDASQVTETLPALSVFWADRVS